MSWNTTSVMEQKLLFIKMWQSGNYTISSLCNRFNISRTTGHKLIRRFSEEGEHCLIDKSKAPLHSPQRTSEKMEQAIVNLRKKHPNWGARKLKVLVQKRFSKQNIPSETTINAILKRNNLVHSKRRRNPKEDKLFPKFDPSAPNEIWSADYKG